MKKKKLQNTPAQIVLYIAIGLICAIATFFLVNVISGKTPDDWLANPKTVFYDWVTLGTITISPVITAVWTGLKKKLWLVPLAGIAGGVGGILMLIIIHFAIIILCLCFAVYFLVSMENQPAKPTEELRNAQGEVVATIHPYKK